MDVRLEAEIEIAAKPAAIFDAFVAGQEGAAILKAHGFAGEE